MNNETIKNTVRAVASTLNQIDVRGKSNLDKLLGCINALETVVQALDATPREEEHDG